MFTGIISHLGTVKEIHKPVDGDWTITIISEIARELQLGSSIACDGVCLTVTSKTEDSFTVEVSKATLSVTALHNWDKGYKVNLEKSLCVGDELSGHFVLGHVDCVANLKSVTRVGDSHNLIIGVSSEYLRYIAPKGSISINGISLTVNEITNNTISINIIPYTYRHTNLQYLKVQDTINIEIDVLARYCINSLSYKV